MAPPLDDQAESLDGQVTADGESNRSVQDSVGEGETVGNDPPTDSDGEASGEGWLPPKTLAGRYRLGEELGRGGMGVVYRATDIQLDRTIAVKLILRGSVARFEVEAKAIAALNHSNIVHVYEISKQDRQHYIVMEYVEGESLSQRLSRDRTIPAEEAIRITISLCEALSHVHGKGIIHRDIKPSNVLLSSEGEAKLVDFGLARVESGHDSFTRAGATLGTIDYMSPEQRRDAAGVDHRSDLWSLAASLYYMATGKSPRVIRLNELPDSLQDILSRALEESPDERFQSADEFRSGLQAILDLPAVSEIRPALETGSVPEGEMADGECRDCGRINALDREFCVGCGMKLLEPCLACDVEIGVWERFCGKCGASVAEQVEAKQRECQDELERIQSLCREFCHQDALTALNLLFLQDHPLLAESSEQLQQMKETVGDDLERLKAERTKVIEDAERNVKKGKFDIAFELLKTTPESLRDKTWEVAKERVDALHGEYEVLRSRYQDALTEIASFSDALNENPEISLQTQEVLELQHPLFQQEAEELRQFALRVRDDRARRKAERTKTIDEAERASKQGKFDVAFELLKRVPKSQRDETWEAKRDRVVARTIEEAERASKQGHFDIAIKLLEEVPKSQREETWEAAGLAMVARSDQYVKIVLTKTIDEAERASKQGAFNTAFGLLEKIPKIWREEAWQAARGRVVADEVDYEKIRCRYQEAMTEIESVFDWGGRRRPGEPWPDILVRRYQPMLSRVNKSLLELQQHPLFKQEVEQLRQAVQKVRDDLAIMQDADLAKTIAEAHRISGQGEFDTAIELLKRAHESMRNPEWQEEMNRAVRGRDRKVLVGPLSENIRLARARTQTRLLRRLVHQYLELCPEDEAMQDLAATLRDKFQRDTERFVIGAVLFGSLISFIFIGFLIFMN